MKNMIIVNFFLKIRKSCLFGIFMKKEKIFYLFLRNFDYRQSYQYKNIILTVVDSNIYYINRKAYMSS